MAEEQRPAENPAEYAQRKGVAAAPAEVRLRFGHVRAEDLRDLAWDEILWLMQHARRDSIRYKAADAVIARTDPVLRAEALVQPPGARAFSFQIVDARQMHTHFHGNGAPASGPSAIDNGHADPNDPDPPTHGGEGDTP